MKEIGRNDPCPCGSGKKFKKCHMGREEDLGMAGIGSLSPDEMGARIASLPDVSYGRCEEMLRSIDIKDLTGQSIGIRFVDLGSYADLNLFGSAPWEAFEGRAGGVFINPYKTLKVDPDHLFVAISKDIDDATLTHQLAHVLDYLGGSRLPSGGMEPLAEEIGIPAEHLEHPEEFGYWLDFLNKKFDVHPDADDAIILHLYERGLLIKGKLILEGDQLLLKSKSEGIMKYMAERHEEIDHLIRDLSGYIGPQRS